MNKLLNKDEPIPEIFYIFVNLLSPITEQNFKLGQFPSGAFASLSDEEFRKKYIAGSARYLPYEPCQMDLQVTSPFFSTAVNAYRVEYGAEVYRERHAPLLPSRLSAVYAFGDIESCKQAALKHGWPIASVKRFRLKSHPLNRVAKVNMEHISLARYAYKNLGSDDADELWHSYWSGDSSCSISLATVGANRETVESGTIWEYLIEGVVEHLDR